MRSLWNDAEAERFAAAYAAAGSDLALRVYTSRLLGRETALVQHGGGNTSVKTTVPDMLGRPVPVICVKGSGWDLDSIEPPGLPALAMANLLDLRQLETLSDEDMVKAQRLALLDPASPNPSVETLLHAWIPEIFIDHSHANAILSLTCQPDGADRARDLFGSEMTIVPYVMPGFALAHVAAKAYEANPKAKGLVLAQHGIFTWGATAQESYERMIAMVTKAEERMASRSGKPARKSAAADALPLSAAAPILRGLLAGRPYGKSEHVVLAHRSNADIEAHLASDEIDRLVGLGVATPDHVIRTKRFPLLVRADADPERFRANAAQALANYIADYKAYFARNNAASAVKKQALDPYPRVVLVPGIGLFGVGASASSAAIAADIAETTLAVIGDAEAFGRFESIGEADTFDMEYWSLEQAKLGQAKRAPLAGQIVAITGGAGTIGAATAEAFRANGAEVALVDLPGDALASTAKRIKALAVPCDITDKSDVAAAFDQIAAAYGGLDVLVLNAGKAWSGRIGEVDDDILRESFELNFFAQQHCAQAAVRIMRAQKTGGALLFNVSKQALNPGADFGPYGLPKAAALHLMRQYAIDYGDEGIRANAVNADRIRSGLLTPEMVAERAKSRGLSEADYMAGNLLHREVTAADVAQAFVNLARAEKTTAAILTVDGGNIAAAVR